MTPEQLEKIGKLFELAQRVKSCFQTPIQLRFDSDGDNGEFAIWDKGDFDVEFEEFHSLDEAKQILLDMFSM